MEAPSLSPSLVLVGPPQRLGVPIGRRVAWLSNSEKWLTVPDELTRRTVAFRWRQAQKAAILQATGRDLHLKARRLGLSTGFLASYTIDSATHENTDTIIVSRDTQQNEAFFQIVKRFYRQIPAEIRPRVSYDTKSHMYFYDLNSSIVVLPPKVGVGAGLNPFNVHASEFALWAERIADYAVEGLFEAVPPTGNISIETTAFGYGNVFAKMYRKARETWARITAELIASGIKPTLEALQRAGAYWYAHKWSWAWKHGLEWARWKLQTLGARRFAQQHGCRFLQSGDSIYPDWALDPHWSFENPVAGGYYAYGVDPAEGVGGDATAISVWRKQGEFMTESYSVAGQWAPRETARKLKIITEHYGEHAESIVGYIERNNHGHAVIEKAIDFEVQGMLADPRDDKLGYLKSIASKAIPQDLFAEAVIDGTAKIADQQLCDEMRTLEHDPRGVHVHQSGYHDDRYTAACLAVSALTRVGAGGPLVTAA